MVKIGTRDEYRLIRGDRILGKDRCPFCDEFLDRDMVLWEGKYWRIMYNKYPYIDNGQHIMLVPKLHKKYSSELTLEEWGEMVQAHDFIKNFFKDSMFFSFTRENFIEGTSDSRSVEYWHMHFLPGILKGKSIRSMLEKQGFSIPKE